VSTALESVYNMYIYCWTTVEEGEIRKHISGSTTQTLPIIPRERERERERERKERG